MFGRIHQLLPAVVVGFLGSATAWADVGYLPLAGPLPLRFRVPPAPAPEHVHLPVAPPLPAPISMPPPMPSMPPPPQETSKVAPAKVVMPAVPTNGPPLEYNAREPVIGPAPATAPDAVISPQMLLQYFTPPTHPATNGVSVGVVTPLGFTPPPVAPLPGKPSPPTPP
jgi:hypothetical protein